MHFDPPPPHQQTQTQRAKKRRFTSWWCIVLFFSFPLLSPAPVIFYFFPHIYSILHNIYPCNNTIWSGIKITRAEDPFYFATDPYPTLSDSSIWKHVSYSNLDDFFKIKNRKNICSFFYYWSIIYLMAKISNVASYITFKLDPKKKFRSTSPILSSEDHNQLRIEKGGNGDITNPPRKTFFFLFFFTNISNYMQNTQFSFSGRRG